MKKETFLTKFIIILFIIIAFLLYTIIKLNNTNKFLEKKFQFILI